MIKGVDKEKKDYFPTKEDFIQNHDLEFKGDGEVDYPFNYKSNDIILEVRLNSEKFKLEDKIIKGEYKLILKKNKIGNELKYIENEIGENLEIEYKNGDFYKGSMVNLEEEGIGEMRRSNGDEYKGNFVNGEYDGKGKLKFKNGNIYDGRFKKGKFDGYGIFFDSNDNKKYAVKYKDGELLSKILI